MVTDLDSAAFYNFLGRRAEHFDSLICEDVRPVDGWSGTVTCGDIEMSDNRPNWVKVREIVRQISEGLAYKEPLYMTSRKMKPSELSMFTGHVIEPIERVDNPDPRLPSCYA